MLDRLSGLEDEYESVLMRLSDPEVQADAAALRTLGRRLSELEKIVETTRAYRRVEGDLATGRELYGDATGEEREELRADIAQSEADMARLLEELKILMVPRDPLDDRDVIVEIRGAEGGEEANLFARDLFEMYQRYVDRRGWKMEMLNSSGSERGGFDEVVFAVRGNAVYSNLKHEAGPHRVQRVPVTESQGRIHTSSATVAVMPEAEEVDVQIDERDLQVDVYRSSGAGGQHVNTTDSAVRITHRPTGIVVACQDERSQIQNRAKAMAVLRARMYQAELDRQQAEASSTKRSQLGGGGRSEKVRTYNYKENRVTDHRIGLTLYKLDRILQGELDDVVDALVADDRARRLSEPT